MSKQKIKKTPKKTPKKKRDQLPKPLVTKPDSNVIQHCVFTGVHFDASAVNVLQTVADGLKINAEALGANADALSQVLEVFKRQNVTLAAPMLQINPPATLGK